jgi:GxxExxY protein
MEQPAGLELLTERVIGCGMAVHRAMGPGLLESIYSDCMAIELCDENLHIERNRRVSLTYKGRPVANDLRLDLVVEGRIIVELKAVERFHPVHLAQVITYLKLTGCPAGLLMNFNTTSLRAGLKRLVHPDLYVKRVS